MDKSNKMSLGEFEEWYNNLSDDKKEWLQVHYELGTAFRAFDPKKKKSQGVLPFKVLLYREYGELTKRGFSREEAYDDLEKRLTDIGVDPKAHDMNSDYLAFDRAYRRWLNRRFKKGT